MELAEAISFRYRVRIALPTVSYPVRILIFPVWVAVGSLTTMTEGPAARLAP